MKKLALFITLISFASFAQDDAKEVIKQLCSEEFHGRGYVNKGDKIAGKYIAKQFQEIGLEKLGKSYFQSFKLDVNTFPKETCVILNKDTLVPGVDFLVQSNSVGVENDYDIIEFDATKLDNQEYLATFFNPADLEGKMVKLVQPKTKNRDTIGLYQQLVYQIQEIAPVLLCSDNKFMWSVGRNVAKNPVILSTLKFAKATSAKLKIDQKFVKNYKTQNVIGYLPATTKTTKTLVICGHYDHLGRMGKDAYFPGANDNASGIAMILELAKYFKKNGTNKNIVFIAFGGEEAGLVGSKYFVENPLIELHKIDFVFNIDIMGSGDEGITMVNAVEQKDAYDKIVNINEDSKDLKVIKKRSQTKNSDHYPFSINGVPAVFIYTQGHNHNYHDINDTAEHVKMVDFNKVLDLFVKFLKKHP